MGRYMLQTMNKLIKNDNTGIYIDYKKNVPLILHLAGQL